MKPKCASDFLEPVKRKAFPFTTEDIIKAAGNNDPKRVEDMLNDVFRMGVHEGERRWRRAVDKFMKWVDL